LTFENPNVAEFERIFLVGLLLTLIACLAAYTVISRLVYMNNMSKKQTGVAIEKPKSAEFFDQQILH
jgi:hypothetical protein